MKYTYFYGELVVKKDTEGNIHGFGFWMEEDGDRWEEENLVTDYKAQTGSFEDDYATETYSANQVHTVVLHHDAGTRTYTGLAGWALEKYHNFLKYFARAQCSNFFQEWASRPDRNAPSNIDAFQKRIAYLCAHIETMQKETQENFMEAQELYVMVWALHGAYNADIEKTNIFWSLFTALEEKWSLKELRTVCTILLQR